MSTHQRGGSKGADQGHDYRMESSREQPIDHGEIIGHTLLNLPLFNNDAPA
jgi:hypothetical protein